MVLNVNKITQNYGFYCNCDQINAALFKNVTEPKLLKVVAYLYAFDRCLYPN